MSKSPDDPRYTADAPTLVRHLSVSGTLIGAVLGHQYQILEVIGEGGIGVVYRARQLTVDRDVAVKVLKKEAANDELTVRRFENEASAIGRLRHPNTLRLYDCQRTETNELYIVTELLSGAPLSEVLTKQGKLTPERALRLIDEVCRSLAEAHAAGIVHRDLKPANIFLDHIGNEDIVKVLDFGIAKILQSSGITRAGIVPGTPHYMAPEQATAQKIDHRADIYSLGVILYQMIAGRPPFDGTAPIDILKKAITEPPPPFAEVVPELLVPPELEQLVTWMMEKNAEDRPASVEVIRKHIPRVLAAAVPVTPIARTPSFDRPRRPTPGATSPRVPVRNDTVIAGASPTVIEPPASSTPWRTWSIAMAFVGVLGGMFIGYLTTRSNDVIPIAHEVTTPDAGVGEAAAATTALSTTAEANRARERAEAAAKAEAAARAEAERKARELRPPITLSSDPEGAKVLDPSGVEVGETPISLKFDGVRKYAVSSPAHKTAVIELDAERDAGKTISVPLEELPGAKKKLPPAKKHH